MIHDDDYELFDDMLNPCPVCGGRLHVEDDLLTVCLDCERHIGWFIPTAGALKLMSDWWAE